MTSLLTTIRNGFRHRSAAVTPSEAGRALGQIARDDAKARRRAMTDQLRADLRAKGHDCPPIDWGSL